MYIKKILFLTICCFCLSLGISQENDGWLLKYEEVYQKSIKENKPIMANFTGSDWCGWCKKLKKAVFDTEEFKKWADENVILFELDYPRRSAQSPDIKQQNRELQQTFRSVVRGYPTVLIFDIERTYDGDKKKSDGIKVHGKMGYMGDPKSFIGVANGYLEKR